MTRHRIELTNSSFPRQAYIDPGTGSMVIQMLAAAIFGSITAIAIFWSQVKTFARRIFRKDPSGNDPDGK